MTNMMEPQSGALDITHHTFKEETPAEEEPPWDYSKDLYQHPPSPPFSEMNGFEDVGEGREISPEDIANSIRKFQELSKQFEERTGIPVPPLGDSMSDYDGERRMSLDEDGLRGYAPSELGYSYEIVNDNPPSEEERSRSDGETEDLLLQSEEPLAEEERSKSDGDQEEDDDDAVPLKIQTVALNKGNKLLLSNSWLKTVPSEVWDLTHLTELDLSANYLKKISKSIGNLCNLKKLRLNHNQLSVLPKEIWGLTRLTALLLNNNSIKAIPKDIKNLTKLKTLDFSSNQINEISPKEGLVNLTSLIELRLRNNLIPSVPTIMAEALTNLQVLWLEANPLNIPKSITKKPASIILAYIKDHPQTKKPSDPIKTRGPHRKSPPVVPGKSSILHGKKDMHVIAEKELKKRKREQLEEMRKHMEVEKKVKLLEHELMLANAKALKFEEEARKVEEQKSQDPPQTPSPQNTIPQPFSPPGQFPPHIPRQHAVIISNGSKEPKPVEPPVKPFEWEIPFTELSLGPRIGRGGYGEVYRGMWGGTEVASKMLFTDNLNAKLIDDLRKEVDLLCKLRHPNIVLFMGACTEPGTPCIVTEYLGRGSLANLIIDETIEMKWGLRLQIGIDCARGMAYLHSRNPVIIHRDLKTDNLLVDDNWQVKVADFGLATVKSRTFAKTMCGTTGWVAPEVLNEEGYTEKADVYSFAIILWEILTRKIPYAGKNTMQVVRSVDRGERLAIPEDCPAEYAQLINDCWHTDPVQRPPFAEVLQRMERMRTDYLQKEKAVAVADPMVIDTHNDVKTNNAHVNNNNNNNNNENSNATQASNNNNIPLHNNNNNNNNTHNNNINSGYDQPAPMSMSNSVIRKCLDVIVEDGADTNNNTTTHDEDNT